MITLEAIRVEIQALDLGELDRWIAASWVRAAGEPGAWLFEDIDVARIRLIVQLRHDMDIEERSLPVVLSLLDQLYDLRRRMLRLNEAMGDIPADIRMALLERLR